MCLSLYFGTGGAFPLFVWSFSQNPEPRGLVSTIFCYRHFLPSLIISMCQLLFQMLELTFIMFLSGDFYLSPFTECSTGVQRGTASCSDRTSGEVRSGCGWSVVWLPGLRSLRHPSIRWLESTSASAKLKQTSLPWKCWLKSSVGTLCLLSWMLVWITLYSLETMEISSTFHLQIQYQVKTANYCPSGRKISQPVIKDLLKFLASQWMWIFDSRLCTWGRYCWRHLAWVRVRVCAWWEAAFECVGLSSKGQNQCHHCFYMLLWKYYFSGLKIIFILFIF